MIMALIISVRYGIGELGAFGGLEARNSKEDDVEVQMVFPVKEERSGTIIVCWVDYVLVSREFVPPSASKDR